MKILFPVDGSKGGHAAVRFAARHWAALGGDSEPPTLLFVDAPLIAGARRKLGAKGTARYHAENARPAFRSARAQLARAGVKAREEIAMGNPGEEIARIAVQDGYDLVVMGSRGHGAIGTFLLGSVANKVLARCRVPVLLVR